MGIRILFKDIGNFSFSYQFFNIFMAFFGYSSLSDLQWHGKKDHGDIMKQRCCQKFIALMLIHLFNKLFRKVIDTE